MYSSDSERLPAMVATSELSELPQKLCQINASLPSQVVSIAHGKRVPLGLLENTNLDTLNCLLKEFLCLGFLHSCLNH